MASPLRDRPSYPFTYLSRNRVDLATKISDEQLPRASMGHPPAVSMQLSIQLPALSQKLSQLQGNLEELLADPELPREEGRDLRSALYMASALKELLQAAHVNGLGVPSSEVLVKLMVIQSAMTDGERALANADRDRQVVFDAAKSALCRAAELAWNSDLAMQAMAFDIGTTHSRFEAANASFAEPGEEAMHLREQLMQLTVLCLDDGRDETHFQATVAAMQAVGILQAHLDAHSIPAVDAAPSLHREVVENCVQTVRGLLTAFDGASRFELNITTGSDQFASIETTLGRLLNGAGATPAIMLARGVPTGAARGPVEPEFFESVSVERFQPGTLDDLFSLGDSYFFASAQDEPH